MPSNPIVIFGAGATKACGGPLTNEILPNAFDAIDEIEREGFLNLLNDFLAQNFHVPPLPEQQQSDYPALPLLLSLIDTAIDRKHSFGPKWDLDRLVKVRDALEYAIFAILEYQLGQTGARNHYLRLLRMLYADPNSEPKVISLNYDIIVDNTMMRLNEEVCEERLFPSYACDIRTRFYQAQAQHRGRLLKLHGSLNWLYCPGCHRLDLGVSRSGRSTAKVLEMLYEESALESRYGCHGSPCRDCGAFVRPVLITPTHLKDYRNPHVAQVWYHAERTLREADRVIIVGYSLPEDDVDVIYLLKRGLANVPTKDITVVEYDPERRDIKNHPVGVRYRSLFGDDLDWRTEGFGEWLDGHERGGLSPLAARLPS